MNTTTTRAPSAERHVVCERGHRHWGAAGAAGVLLRFVNDYAAYYYLQERSGEVDQPWTWSTPGGALEAGEDPVTGAVREVVEEMGAFGAFTHAETVTDDHGDWAYHTVVLDVEDPMLVGRGRATHSWETLGGGWFTLEQMLTLPLHPGFEASLPNVIPN